MNVAGLAQERGIEIEYDTNGSSICDMGCCDIITNSGNFTGNLLREGRV